MGFTAVWITPVVYNFQGVCHDGREAAHHGYWAEDFSKIDPHLGSLDKLREMVNTAHAKDNDIDVIIDMVFNHMCPAEVRPDYQYPYFSWNDFHHNGTIPQWAYDNEYRIDEEGDKARWVIENYDVEDLNDLDTSQDYVRDTLTSQHAYYYNYISADGMRLDTFKHISKADGVQIRNRMNAKITIPKKTFSMGEVYAAGHNSQSDVAGRTGWYTIEDGQSGGKAADSVLNFALYNAINSMFDGGARILSEAKRYQFDEGKYGDPYILGSFIDNHDVARFLSVHDNWDELKESLTLIFTWPGIPIVYYGTEQAMHGGADPDNRYPLWKVGYNKDHPIYKHIQKLNQLRNGNNETGWGLRYGDMVERWSNEYLYAFERIDGVNKVLVMLNTSNLNQKIYDLTTEIGPGWHTEKLYGNKKLEVQENGKINEFWLAPYEILVFSNEP